MAAFVALAVCLGVPMAAQAAPITVNATNVWRADRMPNPIGFMSTALVPWVEVTTLPGGNVADTHVTATIEGTVYNLTRIPTGPLAGTYYAQIPYSPTLDGEWTITATNGANVVTTTRPGFVPVDAMPFVSDIYFTGTGTDITVHWEMTPEAEARLDLQQVFIWNVTNPLAPALVQFFPLANTSLRSVDLSALPLVEGLLYAVEINSVDRNAATGFIDAFSGNWLVGWSPTEGEVELPAAPVPEPATLALLVTGLTGAGVLRRRKKSGSQSGGQS